MYLRLIGVAITIGDSNDDGSNLGPICEAAQTINPLQVSSQVMALEQSANLFYVMTWKLCLLLLERNSFFFELRQKDTK